MQKPQLLFISIGILLLGALYFFGIKKTNTPESNAQQSMPGGGEAQHNHEKFDFSDFEIQQTVKLSAVKKDSAEKLTQLALKSNTANNYKDIAEFWEREKNIDIAAFYYKKAALLENTEKSMTFAGKLFLVLMQRTAETPVKQWQSEEAITCFEKVLALNPSNDSIKVALATCYTKGNGETMKGVGLLKEVVEKNPKNISANMQLGKLSLQSGQNEKAIARFETVLSQDAKNTEALYLLAGAYRGQGNKEKAIAMLEKCKKIINNPDFSKEIDEQIKTF